MTDKIVIGMITKAQGIKGEVKVNPLTDNAERFKKLKQVYAGNLILKIETVKILQNGVFIKFEGINDRNTAEMLRNTELQIDRKDAVKLDDDRYFIVDVINSQVLCDGNVLGKLQNIFNHGSADIYEVVGAKNFMFPAVDGVIINVDLDAKTIELDKNKLQEVAVYED